MPIIQSPVSAVRHPGMREVCVGCATTRGAGSRETLKLSGSSSLDGLETAAWLAGRAWAVLVAFVEDAATGVVLALKDRLFSGAAVFSAAAVGAGKTFHWGSVAARNMMASALADAVTQSECRNAAARRRSSGVTAHTANNTTLLFTVAPSRLISRGLDWISVIKLFMTISLPISLA